MEQKYYSNINCGACVSKVTDVLNTLVGDQNWSVDTQSRFKVLTIQSEEVFTPDQINEKLKSLGYQVRPVENA